MNIRKFMLNTNDSTIDYIYASMAKCFVIPYFQRNYIWTPTECQTLIEDIERSMKQKMQHFLGEIIIYEEKEDANGITDGQQRLTSIMLLAIAVLKVLKRHAKKYKDQIKKFEKLAYYNTQYKVKLNRDDLTVLEAITDEDPKKLQSLPTELRKERNVEKNYNHFLAYAEKYMKDKKNFDDLYDVIKEMKVTVMRCSIENAQVVYENKNSRGIALNQVELIRNFLFSKVPEKKHKEYFENYWLAIERNVFPYNMKDFIIDTMIAVSHIKNNIGINWHVENRLLRNMVDFFNTLPGKNEERKAKEIFEEVLRFAKIYKDYVNLPENYNMATGDELTNRFYEYEVLFNGKKYNSIMLYLLNAYKQNTIRKEVLVKVINAFVVAQCRAKFVGQFKGAQRQNASALLGQIKAQIDAGNADTLDDSVWKILLNITGVNGIPRDKIAISYITDNQLGLGSFGNVVEKKRITGKYVLYRMNVIANDNATMPAFDENKCSIEYIVPTKNKVVWQRELNITNEDVMSKFIKQFGNIALVEKPSNSDYFADKAPVYKNSTYPLTRKIGENKKYAKEEIKKQTKIYAELFCKAFAIPAKYLVNEED